MENNSMNCIVEVIEFSGRWCQIKICSPYKDVDDEEDAYFILPYFKLNKDIKMLNGMRFDFNDHKELFNKFSKLNKLNEEIDELELKLPDPRYDDWTDSDYEIKQEYIVRKTFGEIWKMSYYRI